MARIVNSEPVQHSFTFVAGNGATISVHIEYDAPKDEPVTELEEWATRELYEFLRDH